MLAALKQRRAWCVQGQARRFGDLAVLLNAVLACLAEKVFNFRITAALKVFLLNFAFKSCLSQSVKFKLYIAFNLERYVRRPMTG